MSAVAVCAREAVHPRPPLVNPPLVLRRPPANNDTSLKKICRSVPVPGIARDVQVKIASAAEEWEQAYRLVATNYRARGYEAPTDKPFRFTPYHALPDTTTFVAKHAGQVVATLSLVQDNTLLGLPMESLYGPELGALRDAGRHLVEVTSLADRDLGLREFIPVFVTLMRFQAQYGVLEDADTWVITINPRHRSFYQKMMGFAPLGPQRAYPSVQNHPAEAYVSTVPMLEANAPAMYQQLFGEWLPREVLMARRLPADLLRHFADHSSQTDWETVAEINHIVERCGSVRRWD